MEMTDDRAFTLIELLVVIVIIAVLAGLAFPVFQSVQTSAKRTQAKNDVTQIVTAVNAFYTEYGKYPIDPALTAGDVYYGPAGTTPSGITVTAETDRLFDVLRNDTASSNSTLVASLNPRGIAFLNVPAVGNAANPKSGIVRSGATNLGRWYDPWGTQYRVLIDASYDNNLTNPYQDTAPPGGTTITNGVIAWCLGKNGALGGGAAANANFASEPGAANNYTSSGDVISWQ